MLAYALALLTAFGVSTMPVADPTAPDYIGELTIDYNPIMCLLPPCPPGRYRVTSEDGFVAEGDVISIEMDGEMNQYFGMYLDIETVDGAIWVGGEDRPDADGIPIPEGMLHIRIDSVLAP